MAISVTFVGETFPADNKLPECRWDLIREEQSSLLFTCRAFHRVAVPMKKLGLRCDCAHIMSTNGASDCKSGNGLKADAR